MAEVRKRLSVNLRGGTLMVRNESFRVTYNLASGTWNYLDRSGHTVVKNAYAKVNLDGDILLSTCSDGRRWFVTEDFDDDPGGPGRQVVFLHQSEPGKPILKVYLRCYYDQSYMILRTAVENASDTPVTVKDLNLIDTSPLQNKPRGGIYLDSEPTQYNVFLNSCTPTPTGFQSIYDGFNTEHIAAHETRSDGILYDKLTQRAIVFGFLSFKKWWSTILLGYDTQSQSSKGRQGVNIWAMHHHCDTTCAPGEEIVSESAYINYAVPADEAQREYAELIAMHMDVKPPKQPFVSWAPAYLQPEALHEDAITEQLSWLERNSSRISKQPSGLEYIHVPHGWQQQPGSEEPDEKRFPHGMDWLAEQIHRHGFKASIHLVPFYIALSSPLADKCRPFLIYGKDSRLVQIEVPEQDEPLGLLDPSHPEAQAHLRQMFQTVSHDWKYDLIMIDLLGYIQGLHAENLIPRYYQGPMSPIEVYRLALKTVVEIIREQDNQTLLFPHCGGCTAGLDMLPVNAINPTIASEEIIPVWDARTGMRQRVRSWASQQYMNGIASMNDLGTLRIAKPRPLNEVLIGLTAAAMSGGLLTLGDQWSSLDQERLELISRILPLLGKPCRVLDVYDSVHPEIWHLPLQDSHLLALFNWSDYEQDMVLDLDSLNLSPKESYLVQDFWSGGFIGSFQKSLELLNVPARSVRLLGIREEIDVPQFLSMDTHLGQGSLEMLSTGWDSRSQMLLGVCQLANNVEATLFIYVPADYLPASMACYGAHYSYRWKRPLYEIGLSRSQGIVHFSVQFGRTSG